MLNFRSLLILIRPANGITALSDVLAGAAIAGITINFAFSKLGFLLIATYCLYSAGIIFNDVFDIEIDKIERPNRPIPAGKIGIKSAIKIGTALNIIGIALCFFTNILCGTIGLAIALSAFTYNKFLKHQNILGPLNMGCCRSLNLLLGSCILEKPQLLICTLPLLFIAGITITSQDEVNGNNKSKVTFALIIDFTIAAAILALGINQSSNIWIAAPYLILWLGMNLKAKVKAIIVNQPNQVQNAVKTGILSLIPLNAVYAAMFNGVLAGICVLALLPISLALSKKFAVT